MWRKTDTKTFCRVSKRTRSWSSANLTLTCVSYEWRAWGRLRSHDCLFMMLTGMMMMMMMVWGRVVVLSNESDLVCVCVCVSADTMMSFSRTSVDHSRVKVTLKTSNQDTDYINANFIKVLKTSCAALRPFLSPFSMCVWMQTRISAQSKLHSTQKRFFFLESWTEVFVLMWHT